MKLKIILENRRKILCLTDTEKCREVQSLTDEVMKILENESTLKKLESIEVEVRMSARELTCVVDERVKMIVMPNITILEPEGDTKLHVYAGAEHIQRMAEVLTKIARLDVKDVKLEVAPSLKTVIVLAPKSELDKLLEVLKEYKLDVYDHGKFMLIRVMF